MATCEAPCPTYLPLRVESILNRLEQILADEIRVLARHLLRLFPDHTGLTLQRLPVILDQLSVAIVGHEAVGVDTETVDVSEGSRDTVTSHGPEQSVQRAGLLAEEIPGGIVSRLSLGDFVVAAGLDGVDQIGKKNGVLDEEDGDIIADDVFTTVRMDKGSLQGAPLTYRDCLHRYRNESQSRGHHEPGPYSPGCQQQSRTG